MPQHGQEHSALEDAKAFIDDVRDKAASVTKTEPDHGVVEQAILETVHESPDLDLKEIKRRAVGKLLEWSVVHPQELPVTK